jgi:antitoxin MazE
VGEAILDIKHWGNSLGVRIPAAVARAAHLRADQRVRLAVEAGRVVITPVACRIEAREALRQGKRRARRHHARGGRSAYPGAAPRALRSDTPRR